MPNFQLRFAETDIGFWANRYEFGTDVISANVGFHARNNGCLDIDNLYQICLWKSRRRAALAMENGALSVIEITRFSFGTTDEYSRVGSLTLLKGVQLPTARVILHFCVDDSYPILDLRAIWSLGEERPAYYDFDYWWQYAQTCREIANKMGCPSVTWIKRFGNTQKRISSNLVNKRLAVVEARHRFRS